MPAKGWRKDNPKSEFLQIRCGECQNVVIEALMKQFGYTNKSKFILDLINECWQFNINIPINLNGNQHQQNLDLSRLKFFK